jgi:hypothetical protein
LQAAIAVHIASALQPCYFAGFIATRPVSSIRPR